MKKYSLYEYCRFEYQFLTHLLFGVHGNNIFLNLPE